MSGFISDSVVREMRALEEAGMTFTCVIQTPGGEAVNRGDGTFDEAAPNEVTVKCGVRRSRAGEAVVGGQVMATGSPVIRFPARTVVPANATVVKQAADGDVERTYQVVGPLGGGLVRDGAGGSSDGIVAAAGRG